MRYKKPIAIAVLVVSLVLFAVQARIWASATAHTGSATDDQNVVQQHRPNEAPGLAGAFLLLVAAAIAGTRGTSTRPEKRTVVPS